MLTRLLLLLVVVYTSYYFVLVNGELYEGSECTTSKGPGVCQLLSQQCKPVYDELLYGRKPEVICGYRGVTPIVCCPSGNRQISRTSTTSRPIWGSVSQTSAGPNNAAGNNYKPTTTTTVNYWQYNRSTTTGGNYWDRTSTTTQKTTTAQRSTSTTRFMNPKDPLADTRLARRMCSEYAKSVYTLVIPPTFGAIQECVNISLCAIKDKKLIVGGTNAEPKEFPHSASIGFNRGSKIHWGCGGTLVSDQFVLTAAHCIHSSQFGYAQWVRVGDLDLHRTDDFAQPQERRIAERIRHPNYERPLRYNDIALFKLESPVTFDAYVRPACLDIKGNQDVGQKAVATGWGLTEHEGHASEFLLKVTLPLVSYEACNASHTGHHSLPNDIDARTQFCAGEDKKDTCQGDSGGPLAIYSTDEECMYDVIGVTSFGSVCGISTGVYTRVVSYLPWLESIIWPPNSR